MSIRTSAATLFTVCVAATFITAAPAGKNGPIPVTTVIAKSSNGSPLRVGSDNGSPYSDTSKTLNSEIHRFSTGTDWMLTTYYGVRQTPSNRSVFFDLSEPASLNNAPPILSPGHPDNPYAGYAQAHLIAHCRLVNVDLLALATNQVVECPGVFRFQAASGDWYRFAANPDTYPQVTRFRVTCLADEASSCKSWLLTPSGAPQPGDPNPKGLHKLLAIDEGGQVLPGGDQLGDYYLSYEITFFR